MAVQYAIQADVIDITADAPKPTDAFLVDTNVWYWLTYTRASQSIRPPAHYQISTYPNYTNLAVNNGARLFQSGLSLAELSHLIEKAEFEIFALSSPGVFPDPRRFQKSFRHNQSAERTQTVLAIKAAWGQITSLSETLTVTIDTPTSYAALARLQTENVDGYDLFILESMKTNSVVQVITDDGDFVTVPGIQVFTANYNVIQAARSQGRLITR